MNVYVDSRKCCVESCLNTGQNCKLTFFMVPRDCEKGEKWLQLMKLKPNLPKKKHICSDHFELKYFTSSFKKRLVASAVPTLQEKVPEEEGMTIEQSMETHFLWDDMRNLEPISKNSESAQSAIKDCVIASLYVVSKDDKSRKNGRSIQDANAEKTLNEYLSKRYETVTHPENQQSLNNNATQFKNLKSVIQEESCKENYIHIGQVPNQQITADKEFCVDNIKHEIVKESRVPCNLQNIVLSTSTSGVQHNLNNSNARNSQILRESPIVITSKFPQTVSEYICIAENSDGLDIFVSSIVERLKKLKNPNVRRKVKMNIERILFDAESGAYDI